MLWAPFLHLYQPPTQFPAVLKKIAEESYVPLVSFLERNPKAKVTLNINASLTEQLDRAGFDDVLSKKNKTGYLGDINGLGADPDVL